MLGRLRRWMKRPPSLAKDKADLLIWRSTGLFGDFRMDVCTRLAEVDAPLTDAEYAKVLERYWQHISHWSVPYEVIGREVAKFAKAAGRDPKQTLGKFWNDAGQQIAEEFV